MHYYIVTYRSFGTISRDEYTKTTCIRTCGTLVTWWKNATDSVRDGGILILWAKEITATEYVEATGNGR